MKPDVWVEVDTGALKHNLLEVKRLVGNTVKIMAVVKGNGFGHGYVEPAKAFIEAGSDALAVTRLDEALILRNADIKAPILAFTPIQICNLKEAILNNIDLTITKIETLKDINEIAQECGISANIHIKIDTGMGRLGLLPEEALAFFESLKEYPAIKMAGIYTHFAKASDVNQSYAKLQLEKFTSLLKVLCDKNIYYGMAHAANSAAIIGIKDSHLDMIRPGTILYGQGTNKLNLKSTWKLKSIICDIKTLPANSAIGYGSEFITKRITRTAILPMGYADGFTLSPEGPIYRQNIFKLIAKRMKKKLLVEINGIKAAVIGRVGMQIVVVDITDLPGVNIGDEAIIPALRIPTSALIPRIYIG